MSKLIPNLVLVVVIAAALIVAYTTIRIFTAIFSPDTQTAEERSIPASRGCSNTRLQSNAS